MRRIKAWPPPAVMLWVCMITLCSLAAGDEAFDGFILREGDVRTVGNMSCSGSSEVLNILFMPTPAPHQATQLANKSGRCVYFKRIGLLESDKRTVMSFSTTFTFALLHNSTGESIDGLAFIISPSLSSPDHSDSGYLGILNPATSSKQSSFAVEFDSFPNSMFNDPLHDHVGVDINDLTSINYTRAGYYHAKCAGDDPFNPTDLKNGSRIQAWITYNASTQLVSVTISPLLGFKPNTPLLETKVNLTGLIQDDMYIGFSSSTGTMGGSSNVFDWSFRVNGSAEPIYQEMPPPTQDCPDSNKKHLALILGISIPVTVIGIAGIAVLGGCYLRRIRRKLQKQFHDLVELDSLDYVPRKFSYKELSAATENFSSNHVLGSGVYGVVYKGTLPGGGSGGPVAVAVKRIGPISKEIAQDCVAEVKIIGRLRHRNLVQLMGWCHDKDELLLVYEFMINGSLDHWLFQDHSIGETAGLSSKQRVHILGGVASALVYIHEEWKHPVVHQNVKASNVMVDLEFNAKLGDFGLSRLHERIHAYDFQTPVMGFIGSEAASREMRIPSDKSDVFSFGILALEVASGRLPADIKRPTEEIALLAWVLSLSEQDRILDAVDENLLGGTNSVDEKSVTEMANVLHIGLLCCHPDPELRPSMAHVLQMLRGEAPLPLIPSPPREDPGIRTASFSLSFSHRYQWSEHSVELGMIENSEEIKLIPQFRDSIPFSSDSAFSFAP